MLKRLAAVACAAVLVTNVALATTKEEMVAFVKDAVSYAKKNGKDKANEAFTKSANPDFAKFQKGELYIYAYDFEGKCIGHGKKEALVGKDLIGFQDADKKFMIKELRDAAKTGSGFVNFKWQNPTNGKVENKLGYVEKVDESWWLGSGIYLGQ